MHFECRFLFKMQHTLRKQFQIQSNTSRTKTLFSKFWCSHKICKKRFVTLFIFGECFAWIPHISECQSTFETDHHTLSSKESSLAIWRGFLFQVNTLGVSSEEKHFTHYMIGAQLNASFLQNVIHPMVFMEKFWWECHTMYK